MKITLVGSFPPSRLPLNEYTADLARELKRVSGVELTVVADENHTGAETEDISGLTLRRCWNYNNIGSLWRAFLEIKRSRPQVVWYNLVLSAFADRPVPAFLSLLLPIASKIFLRTRVVITLHAIVEFIDFQSTIHRRYWRVKYICAKIGQQILFLNDAVYVFLDKYVEALKQSYPYGNFVRSHIGVVDGHLAEMRPTTSKSVLIFGRFGGYKRLDFAIDVIKSMQKVRPDIQFTIAGSDHPSYPGYLKTALERLKDAKNVQFMSYIPEDEMASLFARHKIIWLPYESNTGLSGVVFRACRFAVPPVIPDLPDFIKMLEEYGIAAKVYNRADPTSAMTALVGLLADDDLGRQIAEKNVHFSLNNSLNRVVTDHVAQFRANFRITN